MALRLPAAQIGDPGKGLSGRDVRALLDWLRTVPLLDGHEVEFWSSGTSFVMFDHKLGRRYRGLVITASNYQAYITPVSADYLDASGLADASRKAAFWMGTVGTIEGKAWVY